MIQHLGVTGQEFSEYSIDAGFTALEELTVFARQRGVEILLENIPNGLSSADRLNLFNNMTHLNMNYVFDTGHAHLLGNVESEFASMQPRVKSLHVHDNDGKDDLHLFPFADGGTMDWAATMKMLRSRPGQYPLMLELKEVPEMQFPLLEMNKVFDKLEAA